MFFRKPPVSSLFLWRQAHELLTHRLSEWTDLSRNPHVLPDASESVIRSFRLTTMVKICKNSSFHVLPVPTWTGHCIRIIPVGTWNGNWTRIQVFLSSHGGGTMKVPMSHTAFIVILSQLVKNVSCFHCWVRFCRRIRTMEMISATWQRTTLPGTWRTVASRTLATHRVSTSAPHPTTIPATTDTPVSFLRIISCSVPFEISSVCLCLLSCGWFNIWSTASWMWERQVFRGHRNKFIQSSVSVSFGREASQKVGSFPFLQNMQRQFLSFTWRNRWLIFWIQVETAALNSATHFQETCLQHFTVLPSSFWLPHVCSWNKMRSGTSVTWKQQGHADSRAQILTPES